MIPLDLSDSELLSEEAFIYTVPTQAEKKTLTSAEEIGRLANLLSSLPASTASPREVAGTQVVSFRFHLADGTVRELTYLGYGVKDGVFLLPSGECYRVISDIVGLWDSLSPSPTPVAEEQLPQLPSIR